MSGPAFNKVVEIEDFEEPELAAIIREVCAHKAAVFGEAYPRGAEHRKDWEIAMAVRALRRFGALRPDAAILGVAVGVEDTVFYLTTQVKQVFATDRYYEPGAWGPVAPTLMLVEPGELAPFPFDAERLVVQHMDGRSLRYPADTFDGIFSSGSIEHFGQLQDAAYSAYEMGRVLKPGGVLSLSTEFRLSGPPDGIGWPGRTLLFSPANLHRYIVEASGLRPVDELRPTVSPATLSTPRDLGAVITDRMRSRPPEAGPEFTHWEFPHVILVNEDYVFTSVHLTLTKTASYPEVPNEWAKPPASLLASIREYNRSVAVGPERRAVTEPAAAVECAVPTEPQAAEPAGGTGSVDPVSLAAETLAGGHGTPAQRLAHVTSLHRAAEWKHMLGRTALGRIDEALHELDDARDETDRRLEELTHLGTRMEQRLAAPDIERPVADDGLIPSASTVAIPGGPTFTVVVDARLPDVVSRVLAAGGVADAHLLQLMLAVIRTDDRVLDLGAHVGTFSLAAAAVGCDVIAVEASPANAALLRAGVWQHNGFHRLHVVHAAAADEPGDVSFHADGPHGLVVPDGTEDAVRVPAVTVDDLVAEFGWADVSFVKMDIEGYETRALAGMRRILDGPDAPPVLFESNGHTLAQIGSSPEELFAAMEALGYLLYVVDPGTLTRINAADRQVETVWNCIAVKHRLPGLEEWTIVPSLTPEEQVRRLLAECRHQNPDCRAWVAGSLASFPASVRSSRLVTAALEQLRGDADARVAAAAAWSASEREGADQP